jgi:hypothetical protein
MGEADGLGVFGVMIATSLPIPIIRTPLLKFSPEIPRTISRPIDHRDYFIPINK